MRSLQPLTLLLLLCTMPVWAAPHIPENDNIVLERLPLKAGDATSRELRQLRDALAANPSDPAAAVGLARRYFELANAEGDPRYIGYAEAALRPWAATFEAPTEVVLVRALLRQYRHEFELSLRELDRVLQKQPDNTEAISWQFALHLVQADYAGARAACERLAPKATPLASAACFAVIDSINGKSRQAYAALSAALERTPPRNTEYQQWVLTRLAEMALRSGDRARAERHFKEAIATGLTDGFVLAAYADLLLDENRPVEVITLLRNWESSDVLLLRLALAAHALKSPDAARYIRALDDRFAAAALRGDRLHLQEEAHHRLILHNDPARAARLAIEGWAVQREPRDARLLMEVALAAKDRKVAEAALAWMDSTGYEDSRYRALAEAVRKIAK